MVPVLSTIKPFVKSPSANCVDGIGGEIPRTTAAVGYCYVTISSGAKRTRNWSIAATITSISARVTCSTVATARVLFSAGNPARTTSNNTRVKRFTQATSAATGCVASKNNSWWICSVTITPSAGIYRVTVSTVCSRYLVIWIWGCTSTRPTTPRRGASVYYGYTAT